MVQRVHCADLQAGAGNFDWQLANQRAALCGRCEQQQPACQLMLTFLQSLVDLKMQLPAS